MASLSALAWEARQRGITYGELVACLTPGEEADIEARFRKWKAEHGIERTWGGNFAKVRRYPGGRKAMPIT